MPQGPIPRFCGHCLCGAVRYTCSAAPLWQSLCHCESCRRATSSPFTAFFGVADGQWRWIGRNPATFASSPDVRRDFCPCCGSQMAYRAAIFPGATHFCAAALDDPTAYAPAEEVFLAEVVPWAHHRP